MSTSRWISIGIPVAGIIVALAVGSLQLGQAVTGWKWQPSLVSEHSSFSCQQQMYPNEGQIWTIVHDNGSGDPVPWMRMVNEFGGDWNPMRRCETIAERLQYFQKDTLVSLDYRDDPNTPQQSVICAKTRKSGDNCPLLVTLKSKEDPYLAYQKSLAALKDGLYVDRSSASIPQTGKKRITTVNVEHLGGK